MPEITSRAEIETYFRGRAERDLRCGQCGRTCDIVAQPHEGRAGGSLIRACPSIAAGIERAIDAIATVGHWSGAERDGHDYDRIADYLTD